MLNFINTYLSALCAEFYINQVIAIILLFVYGLFIVSIFRGEKLTALDIILSYPLALVVYSMSGYLLLSLGVTFNRNTILIAMAIFALAVVVFYSGNIKALKGLASNNIKKLLAILGVVFILALICTSGIIPISVTNDSMYFFSEYPRALVNYGKLVSVFDHFLTDTSQGVAIIGTLPFFFNFDEIFGIQLFLDACFIAIFVYASYDIADSIFKNMGQNLEIELFPSKEAISFDIRKIIAALACLILITAMPFMILSRWLMANSFFMEYMFIVLYLAYKFNNDNDSNIVKENLVILSILATGLSIMRMEGALTVGILLLCVLMLDYKGKDIALYLVPPMFVLQGLYLFRIFVKLSLHASFQFMTERKAIILLSFLVCLFIYALLIRDRLPEVIKKYYGAILIVGTIVLNIGVLIIDRSRYIVNLKAIILNVFGNSGWGLMVPFVIVVFILIPKKSIKINYFDITVVCYILFTVVTVWARGDELGYSFGDSGNRVMMHVVPTLLFAVIIKISEGLKYWQENV